MAVGLLLIRLVVGLSVASHGVQKLTRRFGGHGIAGTGEAFEQMGFRPGRRFAVLAGLTELGGGLLLASGLATPLGVAGIVGMMLAAICYVHLRHGFFAQSGGFEYPLVLAVSAAAVALDGTRAVLARPRARLEPLRLDVVHRGDRCGRARGRPQRPVAAYPT